MYLHFNPTHGENRYEELQNVFVHVNERVPIFFVFVFFFLLKGRSWCRGKGRTARSPRSKSKFSFDGRYDCFIFLELVGFLMRRRGINF